MRKQGLTDDCLQVIFNSTNNLSFYCICCVCLGRLPKSWHHQPFRCIFKKAVRWKLTQDFDQLLAQCDSRLISQSTHVNHCLHHVFTGCAVAPALC